MALKIGKNGEYEKKKIVGQLRRTQLVTTFGSGSIVDMPDYSVVIAATNYWKKDSPVLQEPNLQKLLKVSHFKQPYVSENTGDKSSPDIPAFRFPVMHFCPGCGRLMPYWGFGDDTGKKCSKCKKNIVPSRFIAACVNGHLEDFPYRWWVHDGDFSQCSATDKDDKLRISFSDETGGLDSIVVSCSSCGKTRSMAGSLGKDALHGYKCHGKRPWIGMKSKYNDPVECEAPMRGLQRSASNVYFSQTASALTIPPYSTKLNQEVLKNWDSISSFLDANPTDDNLRAAVSLKFDELLRTEAYSLDSIIETIKKRKNEGDYTGEYTKQDLYEEEYQVFCLGNYEQPDDYQFRIESVDIPHNLSSYFDDIVMVKRLKEVLALMGFRRIYPEKPSADSEQYCGYHYDDDYVPLSENPLNWYPGIEMLGEGIFIRLNEEALSLWEKKNIEYYEPMKKRLEASNVECDNFSPRYVLLHTLSHLLIRQLSVECGYSGASIKERIYSTYPGSTHNMAGILLYTSSSDSDGSLGGLVRNALPEQFELIFRNMIQEASWCSSDPICIDSKAQGYDSLNYAACHACTLLPETCCEMRNCLLDRGAVVGSISDRGRGFFGDFFD